MEKDSNEISKDEYIKQLEKDKLTKQEVQMILMWANAYVTLVNRDCGKLCEKLRNSVGLEPAGTQQG